MKISFDTNNDSYDDALSALNAAYGVESQSEETLAHGAGRGTEIKTVAMTRDEFEALYASIPPEELRTEDDNVVLKTLLPDKQSRKNSALFCVDKLVGPVVEIYQFLLDEGTFEFEDWIKAANIQTLLSKNREK